MTRRLLGGLLAVVLLFVATGCGPFGNDTMKITAYLPDSAGLFVGNDVGILGVPVGKVTAIEPEGTRVKVTLEVDADQPIPKNAGAAVVARSVATDRYVEITPVYHSGPKMADGAVIPLGQTRTPVDFDTVLAALNTLATGIAGSGKTADAIGQIINAGSDTLAGKGVLFNQAVSSLAKAVNGITGQRGDITSTLTSLDTLTQTIATNQATTKQFIDQVALASKQLADERTNFQAALRSLSSAVQTVARFAKDNRAQLTTSLDQSTAVMKQVLRDRTQLVELLRVMPLALQNLQALYKDGAVRVSIDPTVFTLAGPLVETICTKLPILSGTCSKVGPALFDLGKVLDGVLGGTVLGDLGLGDLGLGGLGLGGKG